MRLAGELLLPEAELLRLITVKQGDVYSREKLTQSAKAISDRLGSDGYAFANVNAVPEVDRANRQAAFDRLSRWRRERGLHVEYQTLLPAARKVVQPDAEVL